MEVQMTDFENAAFAVFIVLLSRAIITMNVNFYIPISKARCILRRSRVFSARYENLLSSVLGFM